MTLLLVAGAVAALVVGGLLASAVGTARFRSRYEDEKALLLRRGRAAPSVPVDPSAISRLPPPVRRYLEVSGSASRPALKVAVLRQRGALRTAADKRWMPFESEQAYSFDPPGFVWLARARMAPLLHMVARDKFVDGAGNMWVTLLGAFTVANATGPEVDLGAGLRFWGEVVAFPEVVLSPYVKWEALDERRARLTVEQGALVMTAVIEFGEEGYPVAMHAQRFRDVGGKGVLTAWTGHCREWRQVDGRMFPTDWESVWHLPEGDFSAVRMEVLSLRTE